MFTNRFRTAGKAAAVVLAVAVAAGTFTASTPAASTVAQARKPDCAPACQTLASAGVSRLLTDR